MSKIWTAAGGADAGGVKKLDVENINSPTSKSKKFERSTQELELMSVAIIVYLMGSQLEN